MNLDVEIMSKVMQHGLRDYEIRCTLGDMNTNLYASGYLLRSTAAREFAQLSPWIYITVNIIRLASSENLI
jgi:hypothetical protein